MDDKWEYKVLRGTSDDLRRDIRIKGSGTDIQIEIDLDRLGNEGWEAFSHVIDEKGSHIFFLKRKFVIKRKIS